MITAFSLVLNSSNALVEAVKCSGWRRTNKQFTVFTNYLSSVNFLLFFYFALSTESGQRSYNHGQKSWDIFFISGCFSNSHMPNPTPPLTPQTLLDACIHNIFRVSTLYKGGGGGGGGGTARKFWKGCTVLWGKLQKIMNTTLFQGPLSMIIVNPQPYFQSFHVNLAQDLWMPIILKFKISLGKVSKAWANHNLMLLKSFPPKTILWPENSHFPLPDSMTQKG